MSTLLLISIRDKAGSLGRTRTRPECGQAPHERRSRVRREAGEVRAVRAGLAPHARAMPIHVARLQEQLAHQQRLSPVALAARAMSLPGLVHRTAPLALPE